MKQLTRNQLKNRKLNLLKKKAINRSYHFLLKQKQGLERCMWFGESKLVSAIRPLGIFSQIQNYLNK